MTKTDISGAKEEPLRYILQVLNSEDEPLSLPFPRG
jgi:hypothetical protein